MLRLLIVVLTTLFVVPGCQAWWSVAESTSLKIKNGDLYFGVRYQVTDDKKSLDTPITCHGVSTCVFGPGHRTGRGPNGIACDSGGMCMGSAWANAPGARTVTVAAGSTWGQAYAAFVNKWGYSGSFEYKLGSADNLPLYVWGALCVGFISLPNTYATVVSDLAPNTSCGTIAPPDLSCEIMIPGLLDLGTVLVGAKRAQGSVQGNASCSKPATITAAIGGGNWSLGSVPLKLLVNGIKLTQTHQTVASGQQATLELSAIAEGEFKTTGVYSAVIPLIIGYY
ncbi:hypothetical protein HL670_00052 [Serratia plymuthica]|nr:hypothetical protein HL670_00052 [Serratia plymuthica]